jgi:hypothetical protein
MISKIISRAQHVWRNSLPIPNPSPTVQTCTVVFRAFRGEVNMKDILLLQKAIKETHGCDSRYVESVPVHEVFEGRTAWQGTVAVFDLIRHPKAKRCYAWQYRDGFEMKSVALLEIPPVYSPQTAVKVAIASQDRRQWRNGQK